ncbi:MAG TPA: aminoglycoside adenylyltransferase domain-containing protein [Anaerolineales bacterium]|nr:aminoglycoside adenylyltransferase domain-containing protein [Anaerolineales bacterium]
MKIDPRIPEPVQPIIKDYLRLTEQRLVGLINASYAIGSIALGEFNECFSDIDFITVLSRKASPIDLGHLRKIHQSIERTYPRWKMSGSYVQASDLGKRGNDLRPYPQFHDGVLHPAVHNGINPVTWWELKNHGIPIVGTASGTLPFTVNWDVLITEMQGNLNTYWRSWTRRPRRIAILYSNWGIQWAVLGVLRQFFTFRENPITTKVKAGEYALGCLPSRWHPLIQEAINIRQGQKGSSYRFRFSRMFQTVRFLNDVIDRCNGQFVS